MTPKADVVSHLMAESSQWTTNQVIRANVAVR
jgi:hypothetical protein